MALIVLGVVVNLGMAFYSVRSGAMRAIETVSAEWLIFAAALGLVPTFFHAARIRLWTGFLGAPTSAPQSLRAAFGTELGSAISPKAIGGAPVKLALLVESGASAGTATSIVLLNNFEDIVYFTVVTPAIAFATASWEVPAIQRAIGRVADRATVAAPWVLGAAGLLVLILLLRRWRRSRGAGATTEVGPIRATFQRIRKDFFRAYGLVGRRGKTRFVAGVGLTTMQWIARCSVATAVMYGLGHRVDPLLFFLLQWVVWASMVFVPTPGATLGAEASFAAIFSGFVPGSLVGLVAAAWRFLSFYLVLLVGVPLVPTLGAIDSGKSEGAAESGSVGGPEDESGSESDDQVSAEEAR